MRPPGTPHPSRPLCVLPCWEALGVQLQTARILPKLRRMVNEVLPKVLFRQWVLKIPFQLCFLFASYPDLMGRALENVHRTIASGLIHQCWYSHITARTEAVTFIQRLRSALNLKVHFHIWFLGAVYFTEYRG